MLRLFNVSTPDRVLLLAALFVAMRLGLFLSGLPALLPELPWWLVGESLREGGSLYVDVLDDTPPLVALLYAGLTWLGPRAEVFSLAVATGLTFFQALLFNRICTRYGMVEEKSLVPAAIYLLFANVSYDFCFISPPLLALTFLLPALAILFGHMRNALEEQRIHELGIWIGMAALCYLPSVLFALLAAVAMALYTGTRPRWYAVLGIGMLLPLLICGLVFYFVGNLDGFARCYLLAPFTLAKVGYAHLGFTVAMLAPGVVVSGWAAVRVLTHRGYINFVQLCNTTMLMAAIAGLGGYLLSTWRQPACLWLMVPSAAYFSAMWTYLVRKGVLRELLVTAFAGAGLLAIYLPFLPLPYLRGQYLGQGLVYFEPRYPTVKNKKVWVKGHMPQAYLGNRLATPYLNPGLANADLADSGSYAAQFKVYDTFRRDMPDVIYDADSSLPAFLARMPILAKYYAEEPGLPGVWFRRDPYTGVNNE